MQMTLTLESLGSQCNLRFADCVVPLPGWRYFKEKWVISPIQGGGHNSSCHLKRRFGSQILKSTKQAHICLANEAKICHKCEFDYSQ